MDAFSGSYVSTTLLWVKLANRDWLILVFGGIRRGVGYRLILVRIRS
jgi:hypothetical protein